MPVDVIRTSLTHPLQIASVVAGEGLGRVGITFCPGKKQRSAATGAWDRDLGVDISAIADWGAVALVTLIEDHEIDALGVPLLGATATRHHLDWLHLPIRDVSVPTRAFEKAWREVGPGLRSRLRAGFDVVVHCKGGLGRAGTVAARLLIDCGMTPQEALLRVRAARPGAVETLGQERYVLELTALPEMAPATSTAAISDRAVGALLGLAVGDAIGTTLEFTARDTKPALVGMVGGGPFSLKPGQWTDDTAMALALADSLAVDGDLDERDLMQRFVSWYREGSYSCTGRCFDIGITTRQALARFEQGGDPIAGSDDPMSAGNGSLMRLAPVAIRHWRDRAALADVAARQSRTTHAAAEAVDACVAYAGVLADAIAGQPRDIVLSSAAGSASPTIAAIMDGSWRGRRRAEIRSSGYVVHSLKAALWCVGRTADFRSAVLLAANLGDDADTVAAITGQLAGALYGASGIPAEWLDKLAWRARLESAARSLLA
jgi:ADP-ribosyl-[dinitrogen reductase] hydrolase